MSNKEVIIFKVISIGIYSNKRVIINGTFDNKLIMRRKKHFTEGTCGLVTYSSKITFHSKKCQLDELQLVMHLQI